MNIFQNFLIFKAQCYLYSEFNQYFSIIFNIFQYFTIFYNILQYVYYNIFLYFSIFFHIFPYFSMFYNIFLYFSKIFNIFQYFSKFQYFFRPTVSPCACAATTLRAIAECSVPTGAAASMTQPGHTT